MKFIKNQFPNMGFEPEIEGYTKMREPSMQTFMLSALPMGAAVAGVLFFVAQLLTSVKLQLFVFLRLNVPVVIEVLIFVIGFAVFNVVMIVVHEILHALVFPEPIKSDHIYFGFHKMGAVFAFYTEDMKRGQMLLSMATPFILLSMVPWTLIVIYNINAPLLMLALLYHAFMAVGDLMGIYLIVKNTPKNSVLKNKGYHTYFKQ